MFLNYFTTVPPRTVTFIVMKIVQQYQGYEIVYQGWSSSWSQQVQYMPQVYCKTSKLFELLHICHICA